PSSSGRGAYGARDPPRTSGNEAVRELMLHFIEAGDAPSVVVLLHGLGADSSDWSYVISVLSKDHRVIAPDMRGHGKSPYPDDYSFELMRDDVVELLDELAIERVAIVGHSMGGSVAFSIVESAPTLVERLVIEDTPPPRVGW